jgi:hypothetical protein
MARRKGSTVKKVGRQTGKTTVPIDKKIDALTPGKRRSAKGKTYWELRKNRSDLKGKV